MQSLKPLFALILGIVFYFNSMAETEPNNSSATANTLGVNSTDNGAINNSDVQDWWKVTLTQSGFMRIGFTPTNKTVAITLRVFDQDATTQLSYLFIPYGSATDTSVLMGFMPGTYYVKVEYYSNGDNYTISSHFTADASITESEPNNSSATGNNLQPAGSMKGNMGYKGNGTDIEDWYKLTLTQPGKVKLLIENERKNLALSLRLYDQDGTSQLSYLFLSAATKADSISLLGLNPGTYYVKVEIYSGFDTYTLTSKFEADAALHESEPNNSTATANTITTNQLRRGNLGYYSNGIDNDDWWKITMNSDGRIKLFFEADKKNTAVSIRLIDQDGVSQLLYKFISAGSNKDSLQEIGLRTGSYFIKVERYSGFDGYTLSNTFISDTSLHETEANNTLNTANSITPNQLRRGNLGYYANGVDNDDWWKITLPEDGRLKIFFEDDSKMLSTTVRLIAQDSSTQLLYTFTTAATAKDSTAEIGLFAGSYFIKVERYSGYDQYGLYAWYEPDDVNHESEPNNSIQTANTLPVNGMREGNQGYYKSNADNDDWWKITLPEDGALRLSMSMLKKNLSTTIRLIDGDSVTQKYYYFVTNGSDSISTAYIPLQKGNYFIKLERYFGFDEYKLYNHFIKKPVAYFGFTQLLHTFKFSDSSAESPSTFQWDFGDGAKSNFANPSHTYALPGTYNVCLIAGSVAGTDTFCRYVEVFGINRVTANKAGNTGDATVQVYGGGFKTNSVFYLKQGATEIKSTTNLVGPGVLQNTFDLRGKTAGQYDVVVETPGSPTLTLTNEFTIVQGTKPEPWVNVVGRNQILKGRWQTYTINYGNNGNVDASGVPLWLLVSNHDDLEIEFVDFEVVLSKTAIDSGWSMIADSIPLWFDIDSLHGVPYDARVYPLYIPIIPAGTTQSIRIRIKTTKDIRVVAWVNPPLFQSPMSEEAKSCLAWAKAKALVLGLANLASEFIPGSACITSVVTNFIYDPFAYPLPPPDKPGTKLGSFTWNVATTFLSCASDFIPMKQALKLVVAATSLAVDIQNNYTADQDCKNAYNKQSQSDRKIGAVNSFDPNEKTGPGGYGIAKHSLKHSEFPYTIFFENKSSASAPAQEVFIYDTLDKNVFDLSTFSFGPLGFGDTLVYPLKNLTEFTQDIDLRPKKNIIARVNAKLNTITGIVYWEFISLDPATMQLTEDPQGGFLPPNKTSPEGEGRVSFTVGLKSALSNGAAIKNRATIIFDLNAAIHTNEWVNTLDLLSPSSTLTATPLPGNQVELNWTGNDAGSGVQYYTIYVSVDDTAFVPLISYSSQTKYTYIPEKGKSFKFYSVAQDSVGHAENKTTPDASVMLGVENAPGKIFNVKIIPNPAADKAFVQFDISSNNEMQISIFDMLGKEMLSLPGTKYAAGTQTVKLNTTQLANGIYFIQLKSGDKKSVEKLVIEK